MPLSACCGGRSQRRPQWRCAGFRHAPDASLCRHVEKKTGKLYRAANGCARPAGIGWGNATDNLLAARRYHLRCGPDVPSNRADCIFPPWRLGHDVACGMNTRFAQSGCVWQAQLRGGRAADGPSGSFWIFLDSVAGVHPRCPLRRGAGRHQASYQCHRNVRHVEDFLTGLCKTTNVLLEFAAASPLSGTRRRKHASCCSNSNILQYI